MKAKISKTDFNFTKEVEERLDLDTSPCYQCGKCTAGCPVAYLMDYPPNQIIHLVQMGMKEKVLESRSIFLCVTCGICSERCPREVKIAELMNGLKGMAKEKGYGGQEKEKVAEEKQGLEKENKNGPVNGFSKIKLSDFSLDSENKDLETEGVMTKPIQSDNGGSISAAIRQSAIMGKIKAGNGDGVKLKEITSEFPGVSERTLRYDLQRLCRQGAIERVGNGGPASYYRHTN